MRTTAYPSTAPATDDDAWIPSSCALCYGSCSILAHRVDGVVVKIEGNPESAVGKGRLCGKGVSGLMTHYDPHRLKKPLRRTNPRKGLHEDPGWKEISWEEALDEIAAVLRRLRAEDPRKLVIQRTTTVTASGMPFRAFAGAFGTPNVSTSGGGIHCGNGAHLISGTMHASWSIVPDFAYCNYAMYFGASKGHAAGHASCSNMGLAAEARARGMKMVVIDPMANFAGAKATEWVPIRVGTDAALALAMAHVLVRELGACDFAYLQAKTNGPYLIGPDRRYMRDSASNRPLVWDRSAGAARPFSDVAATDMALEGEYEVGGVRCEPAFAKLKAHLAKFTPEWAEGVCTVPARDIRRLAAEFAAEARIGSTITIEGVTLPYRPVAAIAFRGNQGHLNSNYNFIAVDLLNQLVGAADVVGACLGFNPACAGFPETGRLRYVPKADADGLMVAGMWLGFHYPYPPTEPRAPQNLGLQDLFVMGLNSAFLNSADQEAYWRTFDLPYRPEALINFGCNLVMAIGNAETVAQSLQRLKFMVSFDLFLTETSRFADIVLPDASYLQMTDSRSNFPFMFSLPGGMGEWCWPIRQPVVPPDGEQRPFADVLLDLAERIGIGADLNAAYNAAMNLEPPYRLDPDRRYRYEEICDADLKNTFGPTRGLDWFRQHGLIKWKKQPQEVYWRAFVDVRVPIYWEYLPPVWEAIDAICAPRGVHVPRAFYEPLPDFLPCASHRCAKPDFDFYAFYYRDIVHTNSFTMENPWLDEAARLDPFSYAIAINADSARRRGLRDGAAVWVESETGRRVQGRLRFTQAIHPEGLGIAACAGHWSDDMPVARGKGVFFNELLELDFEHLSPINLSLDLCARVRVTLVEEAAR
ncbi:molybdopterin-dependent oxidoreductase [Aromatoleum toluclasticum]|uniref:molybdopterin-dependent oxidoreductase n=1 Tax=Aromatoleum toluclasticum TaxID=92003 RepID=UPI001D18C243|nr:molybdopterin-dependent oxidoreductase [Aromatoleum toluclasticum]MCC4114944.1 molybdopterin-dependent oxidoreductase [Aromatoleum toluclasticum]